MEVKIKNDNGMVDATIEMVNGVMVVSPKVEKFEPKDGDILIGGNCTEDRGNYWIFILKGEIKDEIDGCMSANEYASVEKSGSLEIDSDSDSMKWYRPATEEEKKKLFDKLKEEGLTWDAEKKEIVKLKWKPSMYAPYYTPFYENCEFIPIGTNWDGKIKDAIRYNKGLCFKTKEECQELCNRLNDAINSVKP